MGSFLLTSNPIITPTTRAIVTAEISQTGIESKLRPDFDEVLDNEDDTPVMEEFMPVVELVGLRAKAYTPSDEAFETTGLLAELPVKRYPSARETPPQIPSGRTCFERTLPSDVESPYKFPD